MPISQERMLALLAAAKDYMGAIEVMHQQFDRAFASIQQSALVDQPIVMAAELNRLYSACDAKKLLGDYGQSYSTIQLENKHWHTATRRNIRNRERVAEAKKKELVEGFTAPRKFQFDPELNPDSLVSQLDSDTEMDLDPQWAGVGLDEERKKQLYKEAEEMLKKMDS